MTQMVEPMLRFAFLVILALPFFWACASGNEAIPVSPNAPPEAKTAEQASFLLAPGDRVEIVVYNAPELSRELDILPDGTLQMPYVGTIHAADRSPDDVEQDLRTALSKELRAPDVKLFVKTLGERNTVKETAEE